MGWWKSNRRVSYKHYYFLLMVGIAGLVSLSFQTNLSPVTSSSQMRDPTTDHEFPATDFGGSSGVRFSGSKIRSYNAEANIKDLFSFSGKKVDPFKKILAGSTPTCGQWAVVTTIFAPSESIIGTSSLKGWCIVIVGDTITPDEAYEDLAKKENVVYLSASKQKEMLQIREAHSFMRMIPWKSFARKNIGYLVAISFGAKVIYDFDDDNILLPLEDGTTTPPPFFYREEEGFERRVLLKYIAEVDEDKIITGHAFNPYPFMGPDHNNSWPRGFPIDHLQKNFDTWNLINTTVGDIQYSSIGVIQSLCNGDPDSDAIFRLTRKDATNFKFDRSPTTLPLLIPSSGYSPFNAQATTHLYDVFWGLYLPCTVPGRVTDIWRSFIMQRIMREIGLYVLYTPPIVTHERTAHDYLSDIVAETDLYTKTSSLLAFLDSWSPKEADTLPEFIFELWIALYEHDYIKLHDIQTVKEYLQSLIAIGYQFPSMKDALLPQKQPSILGQPYRSFPHFNISTHGDTLKKGSDAWWSEVDWSSRSESAVVKIIFMTMDEWPLVKSWVLYHGYLIGFENLYILDSSTDSRCLSFLRYARDHLGANVIFGDINLNELTNVMTDIGRNIAGSSDIFLKMDTDEFLLVYDENTNNATTSISEYLAGFAKDKNHPLRLKQTSRVGYLQLSTPSEEVCKEDVYATPETFPLKPVDFIGKGSMAWFKSVFASPGFVDNQEVVDLGGHAKRNAVNWTKFTIAHYHTRCFEIEVEISKRVLERHNYLSPLDTDEEALKKIGKMVGCESADQLCSGEYTSKSFASRHKAEAYARFLTCPERFKEWFYREEGQGVLNREMLNIWHISEETFGL
eukprot:CAMPEP_0204617556 /NCGR_PEP_ID=MMETSP0717-20131115/4495_1 /ASSEMBLY_ACC=CAM_ASM_000666 /TAXON_ID=230516 /ORGANISM="Chaetoceros curvisetus" /LENGTH=848 /DNA_ID=CAMNT_0051631117 /DNA_START=124 /DNA_END=2670 /DNA_ORIENTATION=+